MSVHKLSPYESLRLLWGLTRDDRVRHLDAVAQAHPDGALLRTPLGRMLVTSTPSATKSVLVSHHDRYQKGLGQSQARQMIGDGLLTAEGDAWHSQRRDVSPHLRARVLEASYPAIARLAEESVTRISKDGWHSCEPAVRLAEYTLACLGHTMGFPPPDSHDIHHAFDAIQAEALFRSVAQDMVPMAIRPGAHQRVRAALRTLGASSAHALRGQNHQESWATTEGMTSLFLAGYETTASTLAWAIVHLAERPALQQRIANEAQQVLRNHTALESNSLGQLRWSEATFKETLRLRPPVWLISRQAIANDEVDGQQLRPGDQVLILPSVAARREWLDPDAFRPSRFMDGTNKAALWFGAGPRACPGGSLAHAEAVLWISYACMNLQFRRHPGTSAKPLARMSQAPARDLRDLVEIQTRSATDPADAHMKEPHHART